MDVLGWVGMAHQSIHTMTIRIELVDSNRLRK